MRRFPLGYFCEPKKKEGVKIIVFHGNPNPDCVRDGWRNKSGLRAVFSLLGRWETPDVPISCFFLPTFLLTCRLFIVLIQFVRRVAFRPFVLRTESSFLPSKQGE